MPDADEHVPDEAHASHLHIDDGHIHFPDGYEDHPHDPEHIHYPDPDNPDADADADADTQAEPHPEPQPDQVPVPDSNPEPDRDQDPHSVHHEHHSPAHSHHPDESPQHQPHIPDTLHDHHQHHDNPHISINPVHHLQPLIPEADCNGAKLTASTPVHSSVPTEIPSSASDPSSAAPTTVTTLPPNSNHASIPTTSVHLPVSASSPVDTPFQQHAVQDIPTILHADLNHTTSPHRRSERYHPSNDQLRLLLHAFEDDPTPSVEKLNKLCDLTAMPLPNLVLWFKNRRARCKKSNPSPPRSRRRSYVKSGIYSRNRTKLPSNAPSQLTQNPPPSSTKVEFRPLDSDPDKQECLHSKDPQQIDSLQKRSTSYEPFMTDHVPEPKRPRFDGVHEVIGFNNPCSDWTSQFCHNQCVAFFVKQSGGTNSEQIEVARIASSTFFLSELQNGLTITSAMQPLETTVDVLDGIMDTLPSELVRISSGSRVLLREFIARIRSGQAATHAAHDDEHDPAVIDPERQPTTQAHCDRHE